MPHLYVHVGLMLHRPTAAVAEQTVSRPYFAESPLFHRCNKR